MERAFLIIRNHTNQLALEGLQKFYNRHPELRILVSILNRIFSRPERQGIDRIRRHSLRRSGRVRRKNWSNMLKTANRL